ncbi:MAG: YceI family protein [Cyclobacteriaceae bacterium]
MMKVVYLIAILFSSLYARAQEQPLKLVADPAQSKIEWTGKKLTGEHYGEVTLASGELVLANGRIATGKFEMDMTTITCLDITDAKSNKRLVDHLKSEDFFSVSRYPRTRFVITSAKPEAVDKYTVTGDLTIKGKTHAVSFPVRLIKNSDGWYSNATLTFDRSKYDVKFGSQSFYENLGDKLVYDDVDITINLVWKPEQTN